ncbi:hypothetical protein DYB32_004964 [Aphanomyces invadans]|uniref:Uncharacterized protein n=1 Tax=Aphanomyces invadans TaxID=157072 RepID=A0A3R7D0G8_9STRA|nr:hypothetical protein DYB32_004964 [Aphanomyces invadans]
MFGQVADANFCVTKAMQTWLHEHWRIEATVLYDKPPEFFKPATVAETHDLFTRSSQSASIVLLYSSGMRHRLAAFDEGSSWTGSSTSWTEDEDFGLLFQALVQLDARIADDTSYPDVLVVVTGKGPQKDMYLRKIAEMHLVRVRIATLYKQHLSSPFSDHPADGSKQRTIR